MTTALGAICLGSGGVFFLSLWFFPKLREKPRYLWTSFGLFVLGWILANAQIYLSSEHYLPRDNFEHNVTIFSLISAHLKFLGSMPTWLFTRLGGVWMDPLSNNYLSLQPHRVVGYLVAAFTPLSNHLAYKWSFLFLGHGFFLLGLYLLCQRLFGSRWWATLACLTALITGTLMGTWHQEQSLATVFFIPWVWWLALQLPKKPHNLLWIGCCLGLSCNSHYPQLIATYTVFMLVLAAVCWKPFRSQWKLTKTIYLPLSIICFLVSASPVLYSYIKYKDKLSSPMRGQPNGLEINSYQEYRKQDFHNGSVIPQRFQAYLGKPLVHKDWGKADDHIFNATPLAPLALLAIIVVPSTTSVFLLLSTLLLGVLCMGVLGPFPQLLWNVLPGIHLFRAWFHFSSLLNLHLLILVLWVAKNWQLQTSLSKEKKTAFAIATLGLVGLGLFGKASLLFTLPAAAILMLSLYKVKWAANLFVCSVLVSSYLYSIGLRSEYQQMVVHRTDAPFEYRNTDHYLRTTILGLNRPIERSIATAKNPTFQTIFSLSKYGNFFRFLDDKRFYNLDPKDLKIEPIKDGFRLHFLNPAKKAHTFYMLQSDDGLWKLETNYGPPLRSAPDSLNAVHAELKENTQWISITRPQTPWHQLIWMMWIPLIAVFSLKFRRLRALK